MVLAPLLLLTTAFALDLHEGATPESTFARELINFWLSHGEHKAQARRLFHRKVVGVWSSAHVPLLELLEVDLKLRQLVVVRYGDLAKLRFLQVLDHRGGKQARRRVEEVLAVLGSQRPQ